MYSTPTCDNKNIVFAWVSGHVGIQENSIVDLAARYALEKTVNKRLVVPCFDFKVLANIHVRKEAIVRQNGKDIQRANYIRFNLKWMIPFLLTVSVAVKRLYWSHCIMVTYFSLISFIER